MECKYKILGCGGCEDISLSYPKQLENKNALAKRLLGEFGEVLPVIGMDSPQNYRCKVISTFARDNAKKLTSGLYRQNSHKVIPIESCILENETAALAAKCVLKAAAKCRYEPFDEDRGTGLIRHAVIRYGYYSKQLMVVLVTAAEILPGSKNFVKELLKLCPQITTVVQNVNHRKTSAVLGEKTKILYGKGFIEDEICGCDFLISPLSFYQVNPVQTQTLYQTAIDFAQLKSGESVLDAYCGTGTIGIAAAKSQNISLIGVELNRSAVNDAIKNAKRNKIANSRFICADAGQFMQKMAAEHEKADVVFMDPPRSGSDERFLSSLCAMQPKRVVYISCGIDTLARDLKFLTKNGYKMIKAQPVDMFPHTEHLETVCLLIKDN